jgi:hypothetical protein
VAISWMVIGCAAPNHVVYSAVNPPPRAFQRRTPETVEVVFGKPPDRAHLDVGVFEVYQGRNDDDSGRSTEDMVRTLRLHGALRGCDAVQIMGIELVTRRRSVDERVVRGVCEVFTDDQAQHAAAPASVPLLPGEGKVCFENNPDTIISPCTDPLVCESQHCVSPYH